MTIPYASPVHDTFSTLGERVASAVLSMLRQCRARCGLSDRKNETLALDDRILADVGLKAGDRADLSVYQAVSQTRDHLVSVGGFPYR